MVANVCSNTAARVKSFVFLESWKHPHIMLFLFANIYQKKHMIKRKTMFDFEPNL